MIDMFHINIPFKKDVIIEMGDCGFVDFAKLAEKTELKIACGNVEFSVVNDQKKVRTDDLYHPWSTIHHPTLTLPVRSSMLSLVPMSSGATYN